MQREAEEEAERQRLEEERQRREEEEARELARLQREEQEEKLRLAIEVGFFLSVIGIDLFRGGWKVGLKHLYGLELKFI